MCIMVLIAAALLIETTCKASSAQEAIVEADCLTRPGRTYANHTCFVCPDNDFRFIDSLKICIKGYPDTLTSTVSFSNLTNICENQINSDFITYIYTPSKSTLNLPWSIQLNHTKPGEGIWLGVTRRCGNCDACQINYTGQTPIFKWCVRTKDPSTGAEIYTYAGTSATDWTNWLPANFQPILTKGSTKTCAGTLDTRGSYHWESLNCDNSSMRGVCAAVAQKDGQWTAWVAPRSCSATCGSGFSLRRRTCQMDALSPAGSNCTGKAEQKRVCSAPVECPTTPPRPTTTPPRPTTTPPRPTTTTITTTQRLPSHKLCKATVVSVINSDKKWLPLFITFVCLLGAAGTVCATFIITTRESESGTVKPKSKSGSSDPSTSSSGGSRSTGTSKGTGGSRSTGTSKGTEGSRSTGTSKGASGSSGSGGTNITNFSGIIDKLMSKQAEEKKKKGGRKRSSYV